jgi:hypothetical protein
MLIAAVQPAQLLLGAPRVVPDDQLRLVAKRPAGPQPAVAEVVVLGHSQPLVEATFGEDERGAARHIPPVERPVMDLTGLLAGISSSIVEGTASSSPTARTRPVTIASGSRSSSLHATPTQEGATVQSSSVISTAS